MKRRDRSNRSIRGFTLIEVLVIIIIIGVLFAIAAPGWEAFLSRQRISTAREQVVQVLRQTQSEARSTRTPRVVVFDVSPANGIPRVAAANFVAGSTFPIDTTKVTNWKSLGSSDVQSGMLRMKTNSPTRNQLVFDANGAVAQSPIVSGDQLLTISPTEKAFVVTVARGGTTGTGTNRCVFVTTLLGATRLAEGLPALSKATN